MTLVSLIALGTIVLAFVIFVITSLVLGSDRAVVFRSIPAFRILNNMIGRSVEEGKALHISQGAGSLIGRQSALDFTALVMLGNLSRLSLKADKPTICTSGDGSLIILSRDVLRQAYRNSVRTGMNLVFMARLTGATPAAYITGTMTTLLDEPVAGSILIGNFDSLAVLMTGLPFSDHASLAAADTLSAQAALYTCSDESLLGEEVFAAGAYSGPDRSQTAGLITQDTMRWMIIGLGIVYIVLSLLGVL